MFAVVLNVKQVSSHRFRCYFFFLVLGKGFSKESRANRIELEESWPVVGQIYFWSRILHQRKMDTFIFQILVKSI